MSEFISLKKMNYCQKQYTKLNAGYRNHTTLILTLKSKLAVLS